MKMNHKAASAILSIFPTTGTFDAFLSESEIGYTSESFVSYAVTNGLIETPDEKSLRQFITNNKHDKKDCKLPEKLTMEKLLDEKKKYLNVTISVRGLIERINQLIAKNDIDLPKISNTMLTRLKKEPADTQRKRDTLRCLAFWIGHERQNLGPAWNYLSLLNLCQKVGKRFNYREGTRVAIALHSRGDVIGHEIFVWLKKELKNYINQKINVMPYGNWGKVRYHDTTTLYIDFPKENENPNPSSYRQPIRNSISVAHYIYIKWALSEFYSSKRFLSIGIAAGDFSNIDSHFKSLLNVKLPGDPAIRMTDLAHECILTNDIRTIFCEKPAVIEIFSGEPLRIWWVDGLWSTIYWDFIPELLEEEILKKNNDSKRKLNRLLFFSELESNQHDTINESSSVSKFFKSPHNSILGIEIAKTLYHRRLFWEADEILRIVLSVDATNISARALTMLIFRTLALEDTSYFSADVLLQRAEAEASFIKKHCNTIDEDFWAEFGVVKMTRAFVTLSHLRNGLCEHSILERHLTRDDVVRNMKLSINMFLKGMTASPAGVRSFFHFAYSTCILKIMQNDESIFQSESAQITCTEDFIKEIGLSMAKMMGWHRGDLPEAERYTYLDKHIKQYFTRHIESVALSTYRPSIYFSLAVGLWDIYPRKRTIEIAEMVKSILMESLDMAKVFLDEEIYIYSFTRCLGELLEPGEYIAHVDNSIRHIDKWIESEKNKNSDGSENPNHFILFSLNF